MLQLKREQSLAVSILIKVKFYCINLRTPFPIETIEKTQTVETKQEVIVSTDKTIQITEEDCVKGLFRRVTEDVWILKFTLFW